MAGAIKGITIELQADASKFTNALKKCDKEIKSTAQQLREVNNGLKFNPANAKLLTQKAALLEKQIGSTKDKISTLKKELENMKANGVSETNEKYQKLEREILKAENQLERFNKELIETKAAASNIGQLGAKFSKVGKRCAELGNNLRGVSMAAAAVTASIAALAVKSAKWADDLNTLSKQYSVSTKNLQLYSAAANLVDVETDTLLKSMQKMKKTMSTAASGSGDAAKAYEQLGVKVADNDGRLRNSNDVFNDTIKALGKMTNETERDAVAMKIFGKSAAQLNPLIEDGGKAYADFTAAMQKHGIQYVDQKTLDQANKFNDTLDRTKALFQQALMVAGTKLAAYLEPTMEKITDKIQDIAGALTRMSPAVMSIVGAVGGVLAVLAPALLLGGKVAELVGSSLTAISQLAIKLPMLGTAFKGVTAVLTANPIIAVAAAIGALASIAVASGADLDHLGAKVANMVTNFMTKAAEIIPSVVEGIANNLPKIIEAAGQIIVGLVTGIAKSLPILIKNAPKIVKALAQGIVASIPAIRQAGVNIIRGLWQGAANMVSWVVEKFKGLGKSILKGIKSALGIHSPSRVFRDEVGKQIVAGIALGITDNGGIVDAAMKSINGKLNASAVTVNANVGGVAGGGGAYRIEVPVILDGKQIASASANYMQTELNKMSIRKNRLQGVY